MGTSLEKRWRAHVDQIKVCVASVHLLNHLRYSLYEHFGDPDTNTTMKSLRWCITILVGLQVGGISAATNSLECQKFKEPDLRHIQLKLSHSDRYDNPALGMGATYVRIGRRLPLVSIYFFDLGHQTITSEVKEDALSMAANDIKQHPKNASLELDGFFWLWEDLFVKLEGFLERGVYTVGTDRETGRRYFESVSIGELNGCIVKMRYSGEIRDFEADNYEDRHSNNFLAIAAHIKIAMQKDRPSLFENPLALNH